MTMGCDMVVQVVENAPDLSRISPEEVKKYVDNQIRRQNRVITFLIRLVDRLMIFLYISIIYRSATLPVISLRRLTASPRTAEARRGHCCLLKVNSQSSLIPFFLTFSITPLKRRKIQLKGPVEAL